MKLFKIKQRTALTINSLPIFLVFSFFLSSSAFGQGFAPKVDYVTGTQPVSVFAADLDGDTDKDLAVANGVSNTISIFKNNGDGTFAAKVDYGTGSFPHGVFAVDLDGDTDNDLAVSPAVFAAITFAPKTANSILNAGGRADD